MTAKDWRSIQSDVRARLSGPFPSVEAILELIVPTLDLLGCLPDTFPQRLTQRFGYHRVSGLEDASQELVAAFASRAWLQDVQGALVGPIGLDWSHQVNAEYPGLWDGLLQVCFTPVSSLQARPVKLLVQEDQSSKGEHAAKVTASGLQVVSQTLSKILHQDASIDLEALKSALQIASSMASADLPLLERLLVDAESERNAARRRLAWGESLNALMGLPTRVANATHGKCPSDLYTEVFTANVTRQLITLVSAKGLSRKPFSEEESAERHLMLSQALSRLLRSKAASLDPKHSFWPIAISQILTQAASGQTRLHSKDGCFRREWNLILRCLDERTQSEVHVSLLAFLDQASRERGRASLVAVDEYGKAAAIGRRFCSVDTSQFVTVAVELLQTFTDPGGTLLQNTNTMLNSARFSPLVARIIVQSVKSPPNLESLLDQALSRWGDATATKRSSFLLEQFLATLLLGILSQMSLTAQASFSPTSLIQNPTFIEGVGVRLDHVDPQVRRLGMLLAEVVSEMAHSSAPRPSANGHAAASKKLTFGKALWDGVGEGREEARVLRTLVYSWSHLQKQGKDFSAADAHDIIFGRSETTTSIPATTLPQAREPPKTRRLPLARPPTTRENPSRPLISVLDDPDDSGPGMPEQPRAASPVESDLDESSSDSDSSSDEPSVPGLSSGLEDLDQPQAAESLQDQLKAAKSRLDDDTDFSLDTRKRRRPPVYINELSSMLREKDRDAVRLALKNAEALIRRKAGWGGEVNENAIDLAFVLVGLQNNYKIKAFEERRTKSLTALVVASPRLTAASIIEQFFTDSYSIAQRFAVLNALASAARELAGLSALRISDQERVQAAAVPSSQVGSNRDVTSLASQLSDVAISRARQEGEELVPEIKREQALKITSRRGLQASSLGRKGIQELDAFSGYSPVSAQRNDSGMSSSRGSYSTLASSVFIFPIINRLTAHVSEGSSRFSRARSYGTGQAAGGFGTSTLYDATVLTAVVDTISVLLDAARNSLDFAAVIAPETLQFVLFMVNNAVPLTVMAALSSEPGIGSSEEKGSRQYYLLSSLLSLSLLVLDIVSSSPIGAASHLIREQSTLLNDVSSLASSTFIELDALGIESRPTASASRNRNENRSEILAEAIRKSGASHGMARAIRTSAAIVVRVEEMRTAWRERAMRMR